MLPERALSDGAAMRHHPLYSLFFNLFHRVIGGTRSTTRTAKNYDNDMAQWGFVESCAVFHMKDN